MRADRQTDKETDNQTALYNFTYLLTYLLQTRYIGSEVVNYINALPVMQYYPTQVLNTSRDLHALLD